jgi:hypothetical protein
MTPTIRALSPTLVATALALTLAGCGMTDNQRLIGTTTETGPQTLSPVTTSSVSSGSLPPLAGSTQLPPPSQQVAPGLSGTPVLGGVPPVSTTTPPTTTADTGATNTLPNTGTSIPSTGTPTPGVDAPPGVSGGFVSLNDVGQTASVGTDLSGGLNQTNVQGGWTLASGATSCRLNITSTPKEGTSRSRASAPGCQISGLDGVASYQIAGNQVQLYNEGGSQIAVLILSGNRLIGTGTGGIALSMSR